VTVSVAGNTFWIFEGAARFGAPGAAAAAMSHGQRARERACAPARSRCPQRLKRTRAQSLRLWSGGWRRSRPAAARLSERRLRRRGFGEAKDGAHRLIAARARRDGGAEVLSRSLRGWAAVKAGRRHGGSSRATAGAAGCRAFGRCAAWSSQRAIVQTSGSKKD
jgi:hypothetical protein